MVIEKKNILVTKRLLTEIVDDPFSCPNLYPIQSDDRLVVNHFKCINIKNGQYMMGRRVEFPSHEYNVSKSLKFLLGSLIKTNNSLAKSPGNRTRHISGKDFGLDTWGREEKRKEKNKF